LTISLPCTMKDFIEGKLREGRFSTPSEYIRSLIRDDQDMTGNGDVALLLRRNALRVETAMPRSRTKRKKK
jgi:Arc/MetJ-type ribon-helix-helix transcriptional regulator